MSRFQSSKRVYYFTGLIAASDVEKLDSLDVCTDYECFNEGVVRVRGRLRPAGSEGGRELP